MLVGHHGFDSQSKEPTNAEQALPGTLSTMTQGIVDERTPESRRHQTGRFAREHDCSLSGGAGE